MESETNNSDSNALSALRVLEERAQRGDRGSLKRLQAFLDRHPEICEQLGDVSQYVERGWIEQISGGSMLAFEAMTRQVSRTKQDLLGESATPLERLLVDGVVASTLEIQFGQVLLQGSSGVPISDLRLRRVDSCHHRLQQTVRLLDEVRSKLTTSERAAVAPSKPPRMARRRKPPIEQPTASPANSKRAEDRPNADAAKARPKLRIYDDNRESA